MFTVTHNTPVIIDAPYSNTIAYNQILRAANDLRQDIAMVTGTIDYKSISRLFIDSPASLSERLQGSRIPPLCQSGNGIIAGTISDSAIIRTFIDQGKLPEADSIKNQWETYIIKEIDNSLVIIGSDPRGTIYGIYHISEEIGVSPWYWFSDVAVNVKENITLDYSTAYISPEPSVKYRGIFINDEERLIDWAKLKFLTENGTPDVNLYRRIFELLLRLKANTLWPAMHPGTTAFNAAKDINGIPINAREASHYGIVMASSHCEMMLRCNVSEWEEFRQNHYDEYTWQDDGSFDYTQNKSAILGYWKERLITNRDFESILALGIRGIHDGNAETKDLSMYNNSLVDMMADVIAEQRKLIQEVYGAPDAVAQVFIPYKGMADIYNNGLKDYIPDDVMLMWAEDNYGNLRQTPTKKEAARKGGCGVYYHSSYWSWFSPKSYLWLNSTQIFYMAHQMRRAYDCNAKTYWILNVGDIKPGDIVTELFLKMAYNISSGKNVQSYLVHHAMRDYHADYETAKKIASLATEFYHLCGIKKAEFFGHENPSDVNNPFFSEDMLFPFNDQEGTWLVMKTNRMVHDAAIVFDDLSPNDRDAFYQQLYYHILSYRDVAEEYVYLWKNNLAAKCGNLTDALNYKELSQKARSRIVTEQENYWACNAGKWTKVIHYDHPASYFNMNEGVLLVHDDKYLIPTGDTLPSPDGQPSDGAIVIHADKYTQNIKGVDNSYWAVEKDAGRLGNAMTSLPFTAEKPKSIISSARLSYNIYFEQSGTFQGKLYRIPTLNEGCDDDFTPRTCNIAVGIDDCDPTVLVGNRSVTGRWKENIMHMIEDLDFTISVPTPGWHNICVYKIDSGILFDCIVINTSSSPLPPSLLGFPINTNTI